MLLLKNPIVHSILECESTNDVVKKELFKNHSTIVYTYRQTAGKGQYGKRWEMQFDKNIAISFTTCIELDEVLLRYAIAILVRNYLSLYIESALIHIKYPNDIYIRNQKICGILLEKSSVNQGNNLIVGIGINVMQTDFPSEFKATSVVLHAPEINLDSFTENLLSYLCSYEIHVDDILSEFNHHLWKKNAVITIEYQNRLQNAIVKQANADGTLTLELENEQLVNLNHSSFTIVV